MVKELRLDDLTVLLGAGVFLDVAFAVGVDLLVEVLFELEVVDGALELVLLFLQTFDHLFDIRYVFELLLLAEVGLEPEELLGVPK